MKVVVFDTGTLAYAGKHHRVNLLSVRAFARKDKLWMRAYSFLDDLDGFGV